MNVKSLELEHYTTQVKTWPVSGHPIMAQYDERSIIVYQAYRPEIGHFAIEHQYFGGAYSLNRMSWIKPNFLWMMYRSNWGSAEGQEVVLAIRLYREFFDRLLEKAVPSSYKEKEYPSQSEWKKAVANSDVRLQWDPDHNPLGHKCERRAIQLGLRGDMLKEYSRDAIIEIIDISDFVQQQQTNVHSDFHDLVTPRETTYAII